MLKVLFSSFKYAISFNSVIDLPEVLYDAWRDCRFSLATLIYIDNDILNIYDRSLERRVSSDVGIWLVLRRRYAYRLSTTSDVNRF